MHWWLLALAALVLIVERIHAADLERREQLIGRREPRTSPPMTRAK